MDQALPAETVELMKQDFELILCYATGYNESLKIFPELSRLGMSKNGHRRRRTFVYGLITEAINDVTTRALSRLEAHP